MFRRSNAFSIAFWSTTILVAGCASHDNASFGGRQASKNAARSSTAHRGLPDTMPDILPQTHFAAAELFESQGDFEKAIEQYKKAVAVNHNFASAYHRLGLTLGSTGRHEEAVESIATAVQLKPQNAVFHNNLAYEYMHLNRWDDAERELRSAIEIQPSLSRAHINLALTVSRDNRFDEALAEFKAVLPEPDAYYNLGLLYRGQQRYAQAAETFRHVLALDANFTAAKTQLDQVSGMIESRVAEQRESAVAAQDSPTIVPQGELTKEDDSELQEVAQSRVPEMGNIMDSHPQNVPSAAEDVLDQKPLREDGPSGAILQPNEDDVLNREVWLSFIRLAQIAENDANCTENGFELGDATPVDVKLQNLELVRFAADQNGRNDLSARAPEPDSIVPCVEPLESENSEDEFQWMLAGIAADEFTAGSNQNVEVQIIPFQTTECAPLDIFAGMQNFGASAREDLKSLCADYSPLEVQAFVERFELEGRLAIETAQIDLATRREHWFQDFRDLEGLLAISENEALCLEIFTTEEIRGFVENTAARANSEVVAAGAVQSNGTANPSLTPAGEKDTDDMGSSSIARASGPIAPPADRN